MVYLSLLADVSQQTPSIDSMYWIMLVSRILHIIGSIILIGGLFYVRYIISPINAPPGTAPVDQLFGGSRATWAKWVGIATALLLVTGLWNYIQFAKTYDLARQYHMIAGIKMLAGIAVFLLAALLAGRTAVAERIRQRWVFWLNVCLLLGLATVILGSVLRSYPHNRKLDAADAPKLIAPAN
jgi:uncharacterized membrane protein